MLCQDICRIFVVKCLNFIVMEDLNQNIIMDSAVRNYVTTFREKANCIVSDQNIDFKNFLSNKMLLVQAIKSGIPYSLYELIKDKSPFNQEDWAGFLGVSTRTLVRNKLKQNFVFDSIPSEKIIELAEVTALGKEVFDTDIQFENWLHQKNFALGSLKPIELLSSSYGKDLVINELNKIDYGIFI